MRKSVKKKDFFAGLSIFLALFLSFVHMVAFDTLSGSLVGDMNRLYFLVHLHPWKKQYFIEQHKPRYFKVSLSSIEELMNLFYMANGKRLIGYIFTEFYSPKSVGLVMS